MLLWKKHSSEELAQRARKSKLDHSLRDANRLKVYPEFIPLLSDKDIKKANKLTAIKAPLIEYVAMACAIGVTFYSLLLNYQLIFIVGIPLGGAVGVVLSDVIKLTYLYDLDLDDLKDTSMYKKIVIMACMCISIAAFTKVVSVNNSVIDLKNNERAFIEDRRELHLTLLKKSLSNNSANSFTQAEVSAAYKRYDTASRRMRWFLGKHTWRNHRKVFYSTLLTTNGDICKVIKGRFMIKHCPTYLSLLKQLNDSRLSHSSMVKALDKSSKELALIRSSLSGDSVMSTALKIPSIDSKLSIYSILFLGFIVELCVLLLVTRRKQASSIILDYKDNKMIAKKFLISLAYRYYGVCDSSNKYNNLTILFRAYNHSGHITENILGKMVSSFGANLGYDTPAKLKIALINASLISSRVRKNTLYSSC